MAVPLDECPGHSTSTKRLEISGPEVSFSLHELALLSDAFRQRGREMSAPRQRVTDRPVCFLLRSTMHSISVISDGIHNFESGIIFFSMR